MPKGIRDRDYMSDLDIDEVRDEILDAIDNVMADFDMTVESVEYSLVYAKDTMVFEVKFDPDDLIRE